MLSYLLCLVLCLVGQTVQRGLSGGSTNYVTHQRNKVVVPAYERYTNCTLDSLGRSFCVSQSVFDSQIYLPGWNNLSHLSMFPEFLHYLDSLYTVDSLVFPLGLEKLRIFISIVASVSGQYPLLFAPHIQAGRLIKAAYFPAYQSQTAYFISMHSLLADRSFSFTGFANHTWIEVLHLCCDCVHSGFWMSSMPGSGIYYNVGRTIHFRTHYDACLFFGGRATGEPGGKCTHADISIANSQYPREARRMGYDSIQILRHSDEKNPHEIIDLRFEWGALDDFLISRDNRSVLREMESAVVQYNGTKIDALNTQYSKACGIPYSLWREKFGKFFQTCHTNSSLFRAGFNATRPCHCDAKSITLNCDGVRRALMRRRLVN